MNGYYQFDRGNTEDVVGCFHRWLADEKLKIKSVNEIGPWIVKHQQYIMDVANLVYDSHLDDSDGFLGIPLIDVYYRNAHTDAHWNGNNSKMETTHKGWVGTVSVAGTHAVKYKDVFKLVGIHTDSLHSRWPTYACHINLRVDDWPGLQSWIDDYEKEAVMLALGGRFIKG